MKKITRFIINLFAGFTSLFVFGCNPTPCPPCPTCPPVATGCSVTMLSDQILFTNNSTTTQRFYIVNYVTGVDPRNTPWMMANKRDDFTLRPGESVIKTYTGAPLGVGVCKPSLTVALGIFGYASVRDIIHVNMGACCKYDGVTVSTAP